MSRHRNDGKLVRHETQLLQQLATGVEGGTGCAHIVDHERAHAGLHQIVR